MPIEPATATIVPSHDQSTALIVPIPNCANCLISLVLSGEISVDRGMTAGVGQLTVVASGSGVGKWGVEVDVAVWGVMIASDGWGVASVVAVLRGNTGEGVFGA